MSEAVSSTTATTNTQGTTKGQVSPNKANSNTQGQAKDPGSPGNGGVPIKTDGEVGEPKKYKFEKLKLKGKEVDFEADEEEVKRLIQRGYGSNEAYHEAKRLREEAERLSNEAYRHKQQQEERKKTYKSDPMAAIRNAVQELIDSGVDPRTARAAGEQWLYEKIQEDEMSPDARRAKELEAELKKRDELEAKTKKEQEEAKLNQEAAEYRKQVVPEIIKHMDTLGLAKTAGNISTIARRLQIAAKKNTPMTIERAVELTHQDNQSYVQSTVGVQTKVLNEAYKNKDYDSALKLGREIEQFLGEEVVVALQRYGILKHKSKTPAMPSQIPDTAKTKAAPSDVPSYMSQEEWAEERKRRAAEAQKRWEANRGAVNSN